MLLKNIFMKLGRTFVKLLVPCAILIGISIWLWTPSSVDHENGESRDFQEKPIFLSEPNLYEFSHNNIRVQLSAHNAEIFERKQYTKLMEIRARFFEEGSKGENGMFAITADYGKIDHREDSVKLWGTVVLNLPDGQRIETEEVFIQSEINSVFSTVPVKLIQQQDIMTASSFQYNYQNDILELKRPNLKLRI